MTRVKIGTAADLADGRRILAEVNGLEVVAMSVDGKLLAFENYCPHLGGPVCEGKLVAAIETVVGEDGAAVEDRYVPSVRRIVCPWHGYEFDLQTGRCAADARYGLRKREVVRDGDDVYAVV